VNLSALLTLMTLATEPAVMMDGVLETSSGQTLALASLWGKPTVFFYEDRESVLINLKAKQGLATRATERGWGSKLTVIAVANVSGWNWFPAKNFVRAAVRDAEKQAHVPVYLDFLGSFTRAPWRLSPNGSTVMLFDASGVPVQRWTGVLTAAQLDELCSGLEAMIH
jgi:hypothetical protein